MVTATTRSKNDSLNRLLQAVFTHTPGQQQELARALGVDRSTVNHALKRPGAFEKHRKGIAEWIGINLDELARLEKTIDNPDFEQEVSRLTGTKSGPGSRVYRNAMLVPLAKGAVIGPGRYAVISMMPPTDGALVCFETDSGWQMGKYYRSNDGAMVVHANKRAQHWTAANAPEFRPVVIIGEMPDERRFI